MARPRATDTEALVRAAAKVFERKGYSDATIDDIAAEAGVSRQTVYQYIKTKRWLLETLVDRVIYPLEAMLASEVLELEGTARERIEAYLQFSMRAAVRLQTYYSVVFSEQNELSPGARQRFRQFAAETDKVLEGLLRDCVEEGSARDDVDLAVASRFINSMCTAVHRWYRPERDLRPSDLAIEASKILSGFLLPASAEDQSQPDGRKTGTHRQRKTFGSTPHQGALGRPPVRPGRDGQSP